jgi:hypothetical protein
MARRHVVPGPRGPADQVHPEAAARDDPDPDQDHPSRSHATLNVKSAYTLHRNSAESNMLTSNSWDLGLDNAKHQCNLSTTINPIFSNSPCRPGNAALEGAWAVTPCGCSDRSVRLAVSQPDFANAQKG